MRIAYLGWGSLVWNPKTLAVRGSWKSDGPALPIEFARVSSDGSLTLVICPGALEVNTLWIQAASNDLQKAIKNLAERENTTDRNIGFLRSSDDRRRSKFGEGVLSAIQAWAEKKNFDCVVWTDLRPTINYATSEDAISHLRKLESRARAYHLAKEYICNAPQQIRTKHRAALEKELSLGSPSKERKNPEWFKLRQDLNGRVIYKSPDDSLWAVVPNRPAAFGHVILVSWKGRNDKDQDITDCGLFTDPMHIRDMMKIAHDLTCIMKNGLTSNGLRNGRACERVYLITQCETQHFPFHAHLIPRFKGYSKGNLYLLSTELEEARWICEGKESEVVQDANKRIRKGMSILKHYKRLISSGKWAKSNGERVDSVDRILKWWKTQNGPYRSSQPY